LKPRKRGRKLDEARAEINQLRHENKRITWQLEQAELIIEAQKTLGNLGYHAGRAEGRREMRATVTQLAIKELKNFAIDLKRDETAVYEAIRQPWSNGPTEGNVNRLKFLKRQMYRPANFDLLRLKVLLA